MGIAAVATGKAAAKFETSMAKIQGLTSTSTGDVNRLGKAAIALSQKNITEGPNAIADAMFRLQSVGFKTGQTIKALDSITKASAAGLGDTATVADAVASALDAYGIAGQNAGRNVLTAAQATAVLIGTVTKGKIPPEELARAIGRVIPVANALGVSFDQVGASIASMTRQGLNANLAVTGLRSIFQTFSKAQPTTEKALAAIGTSSDAVRKSIADPRLGLFPTMVALRKEFDNLGKKKLPNFSAKTLAAGAGGDADALARIKAGIIDSNSGLAKLFPNVRALAGFLILTGPRRQQNATIFATLKSDIENSQAVIKKAYAAKLNTPIGQLQLQISKLKGEAVLIGPTFIKAGAGILAFGNDVIGLFQHLGPVGGLLKQLGVGLFLFGPIVALFGRLTQAASFGVAMWGRWQVAATKAAYAAQGISIAEDEALIAQRKATVQFVDGAAQMTAAANRTAAAVANIGRSSTGVRTALAGASGGNAVFGKVSKGTNTNAAISGAAFATGLGGETAALATLQKRAALTVATATDELAASQIAYDAALKTAIPNQITYAAAQMDQAKSALVLARANSAVLFPADAKLLAMTEQLIAAERELSIAQQQGAGASIAAARAASLRSEIAARQQTLASPGSGFLAFSTRATALKAAKTESDAAVTAARITAGSWDTAVTGMKSAARLGFGLIGLIFATDVASKIIFSSHQTRVNVVHDMLDIRKSGVAAFSALGLGAALGISKLRTLGAAAGEGGGLLAGLKGLSLATLSWKTKLGLTLAAVLGLQTAGVHLGTIFNGIFVGLATKTLLGGIGGLAAKAGLTGLAGSAAGVAAGFGAWPIALAAAVVAMKPSILNLRHDFDTITDNPKHESFWHRFFSISDFKRQFSDLFLGGSTEAKAKQLAKVADSTFKALEKGVPTKFVKAAEQLRAAGHEYAAEQLLATGQTRAQLDDVKKAAAFLKAEGHPGLAAALAAQIKVSKKQFDSIFSDIDTGILNAFDARTARALDAFDRASAKLEDELKVSVSLPKLKETFTVKVNGLTPAEKELAALDKIQEKRNFQRDIFDANQNLATAFQIGDPTAIREAERKGQDAQTEKTRFGLEARAKIERAAADKALAAGKDALDERRAVARRNIEATAAVEHDQIESALKAQQSLFDSGKIGLKKYLADVLGIMHAHDLSFAQAGKDGGKAYASQLQSYFDRLEKIIASDLTKIVKKAKDSAAALKKIGGFAGLLPGIPGTGLIPPGGNLTPSSIANAVTAGIVAASTPASGLPTRPALLDAVKRLGVSAGDRSRYEHLLPQRGKPSSAEYQKFLDKLPPGVQSELRTTLRREGFFKAATGSVVPGHGSGDTVPAMLTPGEIILNAAQQKRLRALLGISGGGPRELFDFIGAKRYAGGGVAGPNLPTIPGFSDISRELKKLIATLAHGSLVQQTLPQDPRTRQLILGGGGGDQGILGRIEDKRLRALRKQLDPLNVVSLVNHSLGAGLSGDRKKALEQALARAQAHPVNSGLITPSATGTRLGGTRRLSTPHELPSGATFTGPITIVLEDRKNARANAQAIRRELQGHAARNANKRHGSRAGSTLGLG